jgi:hypothetical protein
MKVAYDLKVNWDDVPHFPDDEHNDKLFGICTYIIDSDDIDSDNMFTDAEIINTQWFATKRNKS